MESNDWHRIYNIVDTSQKNIYMIVQYQSHPEEFSIYVWIGSYDELISSPALSFFIKL
jgi:hypothetical protein